MTIFENFEKKLGRGLGAPAGKKTSKSKKKKFIKKIVLNYFFNKKLGSKMFYIYVPSTYRENISDSS